MRAGLPQPRPAVHEVQPDEAAERAGGGRRLRKRRQTSGQGAVSRRLSAEELAVQRLVAGTAAGSTVSTTPQSPVEVKDCVSVVVKVLKVQFRFSSACQW